MICSGVAVIWCECRRDHDSIVNTTSQYNLPAFDKKLRNAANREGVAEQFPDPSVRRMIESDLSLCDHLDEQDCNVELDGPQREDRRAPQAYQRLQTIPGVGKVLADWCCCTSCTTSAASPTSPTSSPTVDWSDRSTRATARRPRLRRRKRSVAPPLRWALGEAACLMLREVPEAKRLVARLEKKHGKAKALAILAAKIARAVYWMLKRKEAFDVTKCFKP